MVPYSNKTFLPVGPPSDDEKKSPVPPMKDKVAIYASKVSQSTSSGAAISQVVPTPNKTNNIKNMYHGQKMLTPVVPGRLTPTGNGRIKVPVCNAQVLKREASSIDELNSEGVCFTSSEAESCADKALNNYNMMDGKVSNSDGVNTNNTNMDEIPLNIEKWHEAAAGASAAEGNKHVSSSSTVITTSSAGSICGRSSMGNEIAAVASVAVKTDPPLKVVRTSPNPPEDEDDAHRLSSGSVPETEQDQEVAASSSAATKNQPPAFSKGVPSSSSSSLSTSFTDNLVKGNSSRQGRSLQRWLVHSPTEELVRQVAGCIPITRDGRIVLVSASRKSEWIIPKGGWDTDETKEECAARETFEEAGLLGSLGGCLEPIDYETRKAKKRRMSMSGGGVGKAGKGKAGDGRKTLSLKREADAAALRPPFSKRAKMETSVKKTNETSEVAGGNANNMASATMQPPSSPDAPSVASSSLDPAHYSYVRLFLFPLYVSSVKAKWPEGGRLRKLVTIDEAIKIMEAEKRPYFCRGLEMIKERGLHRIHQVSGDK